jgi:hypothetical protein
MTQDEADKLMREVEASHAKRKPVSPPVSAAKPVAKVEAAHVVHAHVAHPAPVRHHTPAPIKHAAKHAGAAKKPAAKKTTMKPAAKKHVVKVTVKAKPKASGKSAKRR